MVDIIPVETKGQRKQFVEFHYSYTKALRSGSRQ